MKTQIKKYLLLVLAIVSVFCVAGCNSGTDELQSKIDGLQSQLEELNDKLSEMEQLKNELSETNDKLSDMEEKMEQLEKKLAEQSQGSFYSLRAAFDRNLITENDLMHISYYKNGEVYKVANLEDSSDSTKWEKVDFIPEAPLPDIDTKISERIKTTYYNENIQKFKDSEGNIRYGKDILKINFFGSYNGNYAVEVDSDEWAYGAVVITCCVGGIVWYYSGPAILVYSVNKLN